MGLVKTAKRKLRKLKYVYLVSKETAWSMRKTNSEMNRIKKTYGVSNAKYYSKRFFEMSDIGIKRQLIKKQGIEDGNARIMTFLSEFSGLSVKELNRRRKNLSKKNPYAAKIARRFMNYGFYEFEHIEQEKYDRLESKLNMFMNLREWSRQLKKQIQDKVEKNFEIDDSLINEYNEYVNEIAKNISDAGVQYRKKQIQKCLPDIAGDDYRMRKTAADMEAVREVLGFNDYEYISFYFCDKGINERLEFISNKEREKYLRKLNSDSASDVLNSKCDTYELLKDYYGREAVVYNGKNSHDHFIEFIKKHPVFVRKDNYDSYGRGVELVDTSNYDNHRKLIKKLDGNESTLLIEERIEPHEMIRFLNPDSVNTVRCVTFVNDGKVYIQDCFMKVGRKGSFVDNGGSGGILVHIDKESGILDSNGIDEDGIIYEKHPDHDYVFNGYQLPNWVDALKLAKCIALKINEAKYVGWDLTCNTSGEWIVVEGNALTQFLGQQATIQRGCRRRFMKDVVEQANISF